jgi:hypothetical protein
MIMSIALNKTLLVFFASNSFFAACYSALAELTIRKSTGDWVSLRELFSINHNF